MSNYITFNVVSIGQVAPGFDPADVRETLEHKLRVPPAKAAEFFTKRRILKKGLMKADAERIAGQLGQLGIVAEVEKIEPNLMNQPPVGLELVPTEDAPVSSNAAGAPIQGAGQAQVPPIVQNQTQDQSLAPRITCPRCGHEQKKSKQCESCEVWFHKLEPTGDASASGAGSPASPLAAGGNPGRVQSDVDVDAEPEENSINPVAIGAAAAAALAGALLWKFIASTFGYELGLVAWGIGGAVGFAAASAGSRGVKAGVICGVLAFAAIGLGKYWTAQVAIDEVQEAMAQVLGDDSQVDDWYAEVAEDARIYRAGSGSDEFVRQFMVDRDYTDATRASDVTDEELTEFREYSEPELQNFSANSPDVNTWKTEAMDQAFGEFDQISTTEIMIDSLGVLDILFLLLGVGTAYRLGSRMD